MYASMVAVLRIHDFIYCTKVLCRGISCKEGKCLCSSIRSHCFGSLSDYEIYSDFDADSYMYCIIVRDYDFFHAPIEAEQKKLTDNERKKYRKTSRIVWIVEGILIVIASCFDSWLRIVAEPVIIAWFWVLVLAMTAAIRDVSKENE